MAVLQQASMVQNTPGSQDFEMGDYVNSLREGIAEAYVGIVSGFRASNKADVLAQYMEFAITFIGLVARDSFERDEALLRTTLGLLGDIASAFPSGPIMNELQQPWVMDYIKLGRSLTNGSETRKTANWARELIKKPLGGVGTPII